MVSTILPAPAGVEMASSMRTPGPSRSMSFFELGAADAGGSGSADSNGAVARDAPPCDRLEHDATPPPVSAGDRSRSIGARRRCPGSPPKRALTMQRDGIRIDRHHQRIGEERRAAATIMRSARRRPALHRAMRDSATLAGSTAARAASAFSASLIAGRRLFDQALRAASVTRSGSPGLADQPLDDVGPHFRGAGGNRRLIPAHAAFFSAAARRSSSCSARRASIDGRS